MASIALVVAVGLIAVAVAVTWAPRLPEGVRVPSHIGLGGWDRTVSRRTALILFPISATGLCALLVGVFALAPLTNLRLIVGAIGGGGMVLFQRAAYHAASQGEGTEPRPASPAAVVATQILVAVTVAFGAAVIGLLVYPRSGPAADARIEGDQLLVQPRGVYRLFALRSRVEVPLESITAVGVSPRPFTLARGFRFGTSAPGVAAGAFTSPGCRAFWSVGDDGAGLVIDLAGGEFDRLVLAVADADGIARRLATATGLKAAPPSASCP